SARAGAFEIAGDTSSGKSASRSSASRGSVSSPLISPTPKPPRGASTRIGAPTAGRKPGARARPEPAPGPSAVLPTRAARAGGDQHDRRQVRSALWYPRAGSGCVVPPSADDDGRAVGIGAAEKTCVGAEHQCDLRRDRREHIGRSRGGGHERRDAPQRPLLI